MNIECGAETLTELEHAFKFNDAVLRHLIVSMDEAVVSPSPMMKEEKSRSLTGKDAERTERPAAAEAPAPAAPAQQPRTGTRLTRERSAGEQPVRVRRHRRSARNSSAHACRHSGHRVQLAHHSMQQEAGGERRVECELHAVAFGDIAVALARLDVGSSVHCEGFIARRYRTGSSNALHLTRFEQN